MQVTFKIDGGLDDLVRLLERYARSKHLQDYVAIETKPDYKGGPDQVWYHAPLEKDYWTARIVFEILDRFPEPPEVTAKYSDDPDVAAYTEELLVTISGEPPSVSVPDDYDTKKVQQSPSCFISYSSKDQAFAERLHADLQDNGVRCWFASEDMKIGDRIRPTLDASIRVHDKLLIILSKHSVESDWVEQEVETALARECKEGRTVLFPIRLDDSVMEIEVGWPALIRNTRHIGDFRNWKDHDAYQKGFGRLLRDLKAGG